MKKLTLFISLIAFILIMASCATSKSSVNLKNPIAGTWQLQTIGTEGITGKVKMPLLREADLNCFVGSTWYFNGKGNTGYYTISKNGAECAALKRFISWSLIMEGGAPTKLLYKRLDAANKPMDAPDVGFSFRISELSSRSMQLRNDTLIGEKPASFIYNFVKN